MCAHRWPGMPAFTSLCAESPTRGRGRGAGYVDGIECCSPPAAPAGAKGPAHALRVPPPDDVVPEVGACSSCLKFLAKSMHRCFAAPRGIAVFAQVKIVTGRALRKLILQVGSRARWCEHDTQLTCAAQMFVEKVEYDEALQSQGQQKQVTALNYRRGTYAKHRRRLSISNFVNAWFNHKFGLPTLADYHMTYAPILWWRQGRM